MPTEHHYKHLVIVHGIGEQAPNETALGFMNEFLRHLPLKGRRLEVQNLIETVDQPEGSRSGKHEFRPAYAVYTDETKPDQVKVHVIGFSEVFWQPIARQALAGNDGQPPIPVFTWARSVGTRMRGADHESALWREALDNVEQILRLSRRLAQLLKKQKELDAVTVDFLGDVQMYAESDDIRQQINQLCFRVLARIPRTISRHQLRFAQPFATEEIYIVAHSEGSVVAFNTLVQAAILSAAANNTCALRSLESDAEFGPALRFQQALVSGEKPLGPEAEARNWLPKVKGLVTLGSPIDKHYKVWRNRFVPDWFQNFTWIENPDGGPIPWYNYYDFSDPVGANVSVVTQSPDPDRPYDGARLFKV